MDAPKNAYGIMDNENILGSQQNFDLNKNKIMIYV